MVKFPFSDSFDLAARLTASQTRFPPPSRVRFHPEKRGARVAADNRAYLHQRRPSLLRGLHRPQNTGDLGLVYTYPFLFANGHFFSPIWPTVHTYAVKTVTENPSFQKTLFRVAIFKNAGYSFACGRRKRRFSNTMMLYIVYFWHDACSVRGAIVFPSRLAFSCGRAKTIRIRCVWMRVFFFVCLKTEDTRGQFLNQ